MDRGEVRGGTQNTILIKICQFIINTVSRKTNTVTPMQIKDMLPCQQSHVLNILAIHPNVSNPMD